MKFNRLLWTLRVTLMFFVGVIPAVLLLAFILIVLPLAGMIPTLVIWLAAVAGMAILGIGGLWGATFRDGDELVFPNAVTVPLVFCGLLVALPYLFGMAPDAVEDGGLFLLLTALLLGPVVCAIYFLLEQSVLWLRSKRGASNTSLERDAAEPRARRFQFPR